MLTCDGPALTFPQARSIEERFVREAAENDDPDLYMRQVGDAVAQRVARLVGDTAPLLTEPHEPVVPGPRADVVAFVGGGDNGGDALYACATLADMGISVAAILLKRKRHSRALRAATASGVTIVDLKGDSITTVFDSPQLSLVAFATVWIDGIVGIGGKGALKGNLAEAVEQLNDFSFLTRPAVVSIDVPSGLTDDEGSVKGAVMRATHTMAVGSFKRAQILPPAAQYCGALELIEMEWTGLVGLTPVDTEETSGEVPVYFYEGTGGSRFVQAPAFDDDKYARGVVGLVAGSDTYPGAGLLATRGALASGVGMVRLNSTRRGQDLVQAAEPGGVMVGGRLQAAHNGPGQDAVRR
ncbi:NAD(P)H-hydrate epimerase, partial [Actinomyces sp.]